MRKTFIIFSVLASMTSKGQAGKENKNAIGFELDVLPYLTGGYYGSIWYGHNHMRYRAIVTKVETPEFILEDGFTNNKIQAYTFITDYFFKSNFEKWWIGAGLEYWKGQVQTDAQVSTAEYNNTIFTIGGGYVWKFYKNFYLNPWAAAHIRIAGDTKVAVDNMEFEPSAITPEISFKLGWYFRVGK